MKVAILKSASILTCVLALTACPGKPSNDNPGATTNSVGPQGKIYDPNSNNTYCDFQNGNITCVSTDPTTGATCNASRSYTPTDINSLCQQVRDLQNNTPNCNISGATRRVLNENCSNNGGNGGGQNPNNPNFPGSSYSCDVRLDNVQFTNVLIFTGQSAYAAPKVSFYKLKRGFFNGLLGKKSVSGSILFNYLPRDNRGPETLTARISYKDQEKRDIKLKQSGYSGAAFSLNSDINGVNIDINCNPNSNNNISLNDVSNLVCNGKAHMSGGQYEEPIQFIRPLSSIVSGEELNVTQNSEAVKLILNKQSGELTFITNIDDTFGPISRSSSSMRSKALFEASEGVGAVKLNCFVK